MFAPPTSRQITTKPSLDIPMEERIQFKISMPDSELSNLKRDFLMTIDEIPPPTSASSENTQPSPPPLKFVAYGAQSDSDDEIYRIRFYEADAGTGHLKEGFAVVEWSVVKGDREAYYYGGRVTYPKIGMENHSIGEFIVKRGRSSREEQVLVGKVGGYQLFEDTVRREGVAEHHFSAVRAHKIIWEGQENKKPLQYSTAIDLWRPSRESDEHDHEYEGLIEICDLPHRLRTRAVDSPFMRPLLVWLVLSVLHREMEEFLVFEMEGELFNVLPCPKPSL